MTVADDGGSSGKLRTELGIAADGRHPHVHRRARRRRAGHEQPAPVPISGGQRTRPALAGHAFGNLLIAALTDIAGDFEEGVRESNRVLAVRGRSCRSPAEPLTLHAELEDGSMLEGQSQIERARGIRRVWITPDDMRPTAEALDGHRRRRVVVIGPGSLYTSLLPSLLVPGMREALADDARRARLRLQRGHAARRDGGLHVSEHLAALDAHGVGDLVDVVVVNSNTHARQLPDDPAAPVAIDVEPRRRGPPLIVSRDVVDDDNAHRHDSHKLTAAILELYDERDGHASRARLPRQLTGSTPPTWSRRCAPSSPRSSRRAAAIDGRARGLGPGGPGKGQNALDRQARRAPR